MESKSYFLGLRGDVKFVIEEDDLFHYFSKGQNRQILVEGNKKDNSMRLFIRKTSVDEFGEIEVNEMEKNVKKMLNEDGSRWEGDWYNDKPFCDGDQACPSCSPAHISWARNKETPSCPLGLGSFQTAIASSN